LLGEYYAKLAVKLSGKEKIDAVQKAVSNYQKAVSLATDNSVKVNYLLNLAQFSIEENQLESAISALEEVLVYTPNSSESWKYENLLSKIYQEVGNLDMALLHAQRALALSPSDQRQQLEEYLKQLEQMK
jgi:tetratricopeptide (TPR) repeat protein